MWGNIDSFLHMIRDNCFMEIKFDAYKYIITKYKFLHNEMKWIKHINSVGFTRSMFGSLFFSWVSKNVRNILEEKMLKFKAL